MTFGQSEAVLDMTKAVKELQSTVSKNAEKLDDQQRADFKCQILEIAEQL